VIRATSVTYGYSRGEPVLRGWSGVIEAGEVVAVTGPSGAGKSTLLYLMGGLVRPWSGSIELDGNRLEELTDARRSAVRASRIGIVFQDALLDQRRSIMDNVIEGAVYRGENRKQARSKAKQLLELVDLDVEPTRRATNISGGQAQRVALCRALLCDPTIVLADEPTGNLDEANARVVETVLFRRARNGAAVVIVTHDPALAARCDRTVSLGVHS
jgi:ABC-type lipoprotein export system ATPase subunit